MKIKFEAELEEAVRFEVELEQEDYAKHFLAIFNNARVYPGILYHVSNSYGNTVYVISSKKDAACARDFLEQYGRIAEEETVYVARPEVVYTYELFTKVQEQTDGADVYGLAPEF